MLLANGGRGWQATTCTNEAPASAAEAEAAHSSTHTLAHTCQTHSPNTHTRACAKRALARERRVSALKLKHSHYAATGAARVAELPEAATV